MKKNLLLSLLCLAFISSNAFGFSPEQLSLISNMKVKIKIVGDAVVGELPYPIAKSTAAPVSVLFDGPFSYNIVEQDFWTSVTMIPTGGQSIYDLQSNGSPVQIWQDPNTPANIHTVYVSSPYGDPGFTVRQTKYYFSNNSGASFTFVGDVEIGASRSGFATIDGVSDGNALIANHSNAGGVPTRAQIWVDAFPGSGAWTRLDPGGPISAGEPIWPRVVASLNTALPTKFIHIASVNATSDSTTWRNRGLSLSASTFSGYQYVNADAAETYSLARGVDGRIGLAYKNNDAVNLGDYADVWFTETLDGGITWTSPIKIHDANFATDSLGMIRGISLVYQANSPKVVFETVKQTEAGSFFPGAPSNIRFWSPTLPGADPNRSIIIADSNNVPFNPHLGINDVYAPICRPNIGVSQDGLVLFVSMQVAGPNTSVGADTTTFMQTYLTASGNTGTTWKRPLLLTPTSPVRDWTYSSISKFNDGTAASGYKVNMTIQSDTIPGSHVNGAGQSLAQQMFVRVNVPAPVFVGTIGSEVPSQFALQQNYPNPFNPSTTIRFALPQTADVVLKVYDMTGKEVAVLLNNERLNAGLREINFNASQLPSGVYFYTLKAGSFVETKKMMLVK